MNAACDQSEEMFKGACSRECSQSKSERVRAHDAGRVCLSTHDEAVKGDVYAFRVSEKRSYLGIYVSQHWKSLCFFLRLDYDDPEQYCRLEEFSESGDDGATPDVDKFFCKLVPQQSPESPPGIVPGLWDLVRAVPEIVPVTRLQKIPGYELKCENLEKLRRLLYQLRRSRYRGRNYETTEACVSIEPSRAVNKAVVGRFYGVRVCVIEVEHPGRREKPRPCLVMRIYDNGKGEDKGKVLVLPVVSFSKRKGDRIEFDTLENVFEEEVLYASQYFIPVRYQSDEALNFNSVFVAPRLKYDEGYIVACEYKLEVKGIWSLDDLDGTRYMCRSKVDEEGFRHVCEVVKNIGGGQGGSEGGNPGGSGGDNPDGSGGDNPDGSGGDNPDGSGGDNLDGSGGGNPGGSGGGNPGGSGGGNPGGSGGGNPGGSGGGNPGGSGGGNPDGSGGGRQGRSGGRGGRRGGRRQKGGNMPENTGEVTKKDSKRGSVGSEGSKESEMNHDQVYELSCISKDTKDLDDLDWSWDGVSPWLPICNQQETDKFPHQFATNVIETLDKRVLERLNQHMEFHLEMNTTSPSLREVNEGTTSKFPLETLLDSSFETLLDLMMGVITEDMDSDILYEVIEDLLKTIEELELEEVNSKDELEIVLKREGKTLWKINNDNLVECIKWDNVECYNQSGDHTFSHALREENWENDDLYLECDDDEDKEKFLLKICFWTNVKVTHLIVKSPPEKGPTTLKLFVNKPHMGYGDEEKETQTIELKPENLEGVQVTLEAWKFQSVESLQVCAEGPEGQTVQVTKFALIGSTKETTDASKLERQCSMAYVLTQFGDSVK